MTKRYGLILRSLVLVAIMFSVALINGCSNQSLVGPDSDNETPRDPFSSASVEAHWGKVWDIEAGEPVEALIDAAGGDINFSINSNEDRADYRIPSGSLNSEVLIACAPTAYYIEDGVVYVFEFGPGGTSFDVPTFLVLDMSVFNDFRDAEDYVGAEIHYWNPVSVKWELLQVQYASADGQVIFEIDHFSRYGIGGRTAN